MRNEGCLVFQDIRWRTDTAGTEFDSFYRRLSEFFVDELMRILIKNLRFSYPHAEVFLSDLFELEKIKEEMLHGRPGISLDAYSQISSVVASLGLSRIFKPKGEVQIEIGHRPGYASVHEQLKTLKKTLPKEKYCLIEDDVFTGLTLKNVIQVLVNNGFDIFEAVVGLQVGEPQLKTPIKAIHSFPNGEVINVADPRDFLIGSYEGGLAIRLNNGKHVRAPYIWPFVNPTARVNIPKQKALAFSVEVFQLNRKVFEKIDALLGRSLIISELWPSFYDYLIEAYSFYPNASVINMIDKLLISLQNEHAILQL